VPLDQVIQKLPSVEVSAQVNLKRHLWSIVTGSVATHTTRIFGA
jgi:hypothetical protein